MNRHSEMAGLMWPMAHKTLFLFGLFLICALLIGRIFFSLPVKDELINNTRDFKSDKTYHLQCPLQYQECSLHLTEDLSLRFSLQPNGLPILQPLVLSISEPSISERPDSARSFPIGSSLSDSILSSSDSKSKPGNKLSELENILAWFEGRDMNMGQHFILFSTENDMNSRINGTGMIPVCTIDENMVWRLIVQFTYQGQAMRVEFDLSSENVHL